MTEEYYVIRHDPADKTSKEIVAKFDDEKKAQRFLKKKEKEAASLFFYIELVLS